MGSALDKLTIRGFKSIKSLGDFELGKLNVMIGGNGAGKSNFVDFFWLLRAMVDENLQGFAVKYGGADGFFFMGPKHTRHIAAHLEFGQVIYEFSLAPTSSAGLMIEQEHIHHAGGSSAGGSTYSMSKGARESVLKESHDKKSEKGWWFNSLGIDIYESISSWVAYHFHDTSATAPMRRSEITADNVRLRPDASNIAPFLLELRNEKPKCYDEVVGAIRLVTPFFNDFMLKPTKKGERELVNLSWKQKGSDYPMQPYHFSDGTIRFVCLATALLQPDPPSTIVIDEPELGLHPYAIEILAELIQAASERTQVIVSTQSSPLIDNFSPEDIVVVSRENGASTFKRLDAKELSHWLDDYSLGDLWRKNIVAGGPVHE